MISTWKSKGNFSVVEVVGIQSLWVESIYYPELWLTMVFAQPDFHKTLSTVSFCISNQFLKFMIHPVEKQYSSADRVPAIQHIRTLCWVADWCYPRGNFVDSFHFPNQICFTSWAQTSHFVLPDSQTKADTLYSLKFPNHFPLRNANRCDFSAVRCN